MAPHVSDRARAREARNDASSGSQALPPLPRAAGDGRAAKAMPCTKTGRPNLIGGVRSRTRPQAPVGMDRTAPSLPRIPLHLPFQGHSIEAFHPAFFR